MELLTFIVAAAALSVLVIALTHLSVWLGSLKTKNEEEENRSRDREKRNRSSKSYQTSAHIISASIEGIGDQFYTQSVEQSRHEKKRTLLEISGVSAAFIAAMLALWSAIIFQGQLQEMRYEQRPWITGEFQLNGISVQHMMVQIDFTTTMDNIGHSPARHVFTSFALVPAIFEAAIKSQKKACTDIKSNWVESTRQDSVLFPGKKQIVNNLVAANPNDITDFMNWRLDMFKKQNNALAIQGGIPIINQVQFMVVGCISYEFDSSNDIHQTGVIIVLGKKGNRTSMAYIDISKNGVLAGEDFVLSQLSIGSFAN